MSLPITAEPLPTSYTFGKVVGRVIHLIADTAEDTDDKPQARAAAGKVTFTPKEVLRKTTDADYPAIVLHKRETATLSNSGRILDAEGRQGIWLAVGIYTVTFEIKDAARAVPDFDIAVTDAHTDAAPLDLATVVPYVPPSGTVVQTVLIPSGGTEGQVLVRTADGALAWANQTGGTGGGTAGEDGASAYEVAVANGYVGTEAAWLASLVGPEGPEGPTGPQGEIGPQGPQGPEGPAGPTGPQGEIGPAGEAGADGQSAYQIARDQGYGGTETQWLTTLVGEQGPQGPVGETGPVGPEGPQGPQGEPGTSYTDTQAVDAVEAAATVTPTGAWDFAQAPTIAGAPIGTGGNAEAPPASSHANTVALLGTSITDANAPYDQGGGVMADTGSGYFHWANTLLRQSMRLVLEAGVSGDTTGGMLSRVGTVLDSGAKMCVVETGPNDVQGDSTFTNITTSLASIYETLRDAGILVFATHIYPTTTITSSAARVAVMHRVNRWITDYSRSNPGVVVVPWAARVTDPATGGPVTGALHDGIHPSTYGAALLGSVLADAMEQYVVAASDLVYSNADPGQLISNGMLLGGTTAATGWTVNGTATASKVPRADGDPGEWQQLAPGSGNVELWSPIGTTGWAAGDAVFADFEVDGDLTNATRAEVQVWAVDGAGFPVAGGAAITLADYYGSTKRIPVSRGVMRSRPLTIPAGATGVRAVFIVAGPVTVRVARASVRKVTI